LYEVDEKGSRYFLNLEKANQAKKCISQIKDEDGNVIVKAELIRNEIAKYYKKLYATGMDRCTNREKDSFYRVLIRL
jgi:hypothetical protein